MIPQEEDQEQRALLEVRFWKNQAETLERGLSDTKSTKTSRSRNQTRKLSVLEALSATDDLGGGARGRNNTPRTHTRGACGTVEETRDGA